MKPSESASLLPSTAYTIYTPQPNIASQPPSGRRYIPIDQETTQCRSLSHYTPQRLTIYIRNHFPDGYPPRTPYILFISACILSATLFIVLLTMDIDLTYVEAVYIPLICFTAGCVHICLQKLCPKKPEILPA